jgi:allantoate deiminase
MLAARGPAARRALDRLDELYELGGGEGANRVAFTPAEQAACELAARWMAEAGLEVEWDAAGNVFGRLRGARLQLPEVWSGSHLDSVPQGGRLDGALGVVAALEAVEAVARTGRASRTLAVVVFRDEEGGRFPRGAFGSRALCGGLDASELAELGRDIPPAGWLAPVPAAFVEAHVEQGPVLALAGAPLGVVTAITAMTRFGRVFTGSAGHAGTTPMAAREDALCAAAEYVLAVREAARSIDGAVATVGTLAVEPGAPNVVPNRVTVSVDARAPDRPRLDRLLEALGSDPGRGRDAAVMAPELTAVLRRELEGRGLPPLELVSGAGHDAGILAAAGVPTAMLFVRSLAGGVSHSPAEDTSDDDVGLCIDVLSAVLAKVSAR